MTVIVARFCSSWHSRFKQSDPNPCIHDHNEREGSQVNIGEQNCGVDLSHLLTGPVFPAPVERARPVAVSQEHTDALFFSHLKHDSRRAHD